MSRDPSQALFASLKGSTQDDMPELLRKLVDFNQALNRMSVEATL